MVFGNYFSFWEGQFSGDMLFFLRAGTPFENKNEKAANELPKKNQRPCFKKKCNKNLVRSLPIHPQGKNKSALERCFFLGKGGGNVFGKDMASPKKAPLPAMEQSWQRLPQLPPIAQHCKEFWSSHCRTGSDFLLGVLGCLNSS